MPLSIPTLTYKKVFERREPRLEFRRIYSFSVSVKIGSGGPTGHSSRDLGNVGLRVHGKTGEPFESRESLSPPQGSLPSTSTVKPSVA